MREDTFMQPTIWRLAGPLAAVLLMPAGSAALAQSAPAVGSQGSVALSGPQVGSPAPNFNLRTLDGRAVSLQSYRGKTLIVNVWATWCPPCRQETADLIAGYAELHKAGVEFLGVDSTEQAPIVKAFVAGKGVPFPQSIDADKSFVDAYDIRYFPTTYVIDPKGIVRARYIDVMSIAQLRSFVASAQAGHDAEISSPQQTKIDELLAQPVAFDGDAASVLASVKTVSERLDRAEALLADGDASRGLAVDLLRTRTAEAAIRDRAIEALARIAGDPEQFLLARMRGDAARDRELWKDALTNYNAALAIDPKDRDALEGASFVAHALRDFPRAIAAEELLVSLAPTDPEPRVTLAKSYAAVKRFDRAQAAAESAVTVARTAVDAKPTDAKRIRTLAWTHLYAGRIDVQAGERAKARGHFARLVDWTLKLPKTDARYAMYLEEAQEAVVALDLDGPKAQTSLSLAPWTGPDLPGSIPDTIKYRLVVAGLSGRNVALRASGVPKGWVASFCTDRVCAPFKLSVELPSSGVKVIEFQLVPDAKPARVPKVRVIGTDGRRSASATT